MRACTRARAPRCTRLSGRGLARPRATGEWPYASCASRSAGLGEEHPQGGVLARLIAAPAGAALRLTTRPYRAMWLSAALSVAAMWLGLTLSYAYPKLPPSLAVIATASAVYLEATLRAQAAARTVM